MIMWPLMQVMRISVAVWSTDKEDVDGSVDHVVA